MLSENQALKKQVDELTQENEGLVGRWACDRLCVSLVEPDDCVKIHGWEFKEE